MKPTPRIKPRGRTAKGWRNAQRGITGLRVHISGNRQRGPVPEFVPSGAMQNHRRRSW